MIQFAEQFSDFEKVVTLSRVLSWSHFLILIPIKDIEARDFYGMNSAESSWGVRELRKQIDKKLYERTEHANIQLYNSSTISTNIFKDPYLLDFLELKNGFLEDDLESSILIILRYKNEYIID